MYTRCGSGSTFFLAVSVDVFAPMPASNLLHQVLRNEMHSGRMPDAKKTRNCVISVTLVGESGRLPLPPEAGIVEIADEAGLGDVFSVEAAPGKLLVDQAQ
jgi:hypothetical protein